MSNEGVDYSTARPSPSGLRAAGKRFVVRYGGPGGDGKHLHAAELAGLLAPGLSVVANAEGSKGGYRGEAAGRSWATSAEAHFRGLGMPADRPIYFSVDFNAGSGDWADIDAALRGSAAVIGADRVGVYGGYNTIAHCVSAKTAAWFWQTYAWSDGRWHPRNHLEQYRNGVTVAGGDCDLNRALTTDFGQWGQGDIMPTVAEIRDAILNDKVIANPDGSKNPVSLAGIIRPTYNEAHNAGNQVDKIVAMLGNPAALAKAIVAEFAGQSPTTIAAALKAVLGDQAPAVGALLVA